jgi:hypothetical protein
MTMPAVTRVLAIWLFGGLAALSVSLTRENIQSADVTVFAQELDHTSTMDPDFFKANLSLVEASGPLHSCRTDQLRPLFDVRMNELDFFYGHEEIGKTQERLSSSAAFLRHFLTCVPTDGNVMALDALVLNTIQKSDQRLYDILSLSQFYVPARSNVVTLRTRVAMSVDWQHDKTMEALLGRDLRIMALYFKPSELKRFAATAPPEVMQKLKEYAGSAPLDRQVDLMDIL